MLYSAVSTLVAQLSFDKNQSVTLFSDRSAASVRSGFLEVENAIFILVPTELLAELN